MEWCGSHSWKFRKYHYRWRRQVYETLCVILYHFCNLKNVKNTHGRVLLLLKLQSEKRNTPPWMFLHFFKLYKWYEIAQSIIYFGCSAYLFLFIAWLKRSVASMNVHESSCNITKNFMLPTCYLVNKMYLVFSLYFKVVVEKLS